MKYLIKNIFGYLFCSIILWSCSEEKNESPQKNAVKEETSTPSTVIEEAPNEIIKSTPGKLEQKLIEAGLVNIQEIDSTIMVDLKYSSIDNFAGIDLYGALEHCYLQQKPAEMIAKAQQFLQERHPDYSLLVYDCARPLYIQKILWDTLDMPINKKKTYVADPAVGSIHNYGSAVDLTIVSKDGSPLDMGTTYDYFGTLAYPSKENEMLDKGLLNEQQIKNRELLREVMIKAGFSPIKYEWWHFNAISRARAKEVYEIIE